MTYFCTDVASTRIISERTNICEGQLTGVTNQRTLENFARVGEKIMVRAVPPLLIANTLLVPGYIDEVEIRAIARFIAAIHPDIP